MFSGRPIHVMLLLIFCLTTVGCGKSSTSTGKSTDVEESLLGDILDDVDLTDGGPPDDDLSSLIVPTGLDSSNSAVRGIRPDDSKLELRLVRGDRFRLSKIVEQTLVQQSDQFPATAQNRLDLSMEIQVDDVQPDFILMSVMYTKVAYFHEINGQSLAYDSATHSGSLHADMIPYAGMVNNGFSFRLGRDNRIREVLGFNEFLQRCVQHVSPENKQSLLPTLASRFENDGVAGFVDDTVALLPYNDGSSSPAQVREGDEWVRKRRLTSPNPTELQTTCRLLSLNESTAEIGLTETVTPDSAAAVSELPVSITGGRATGSCIVDRATGLPLEVTRSRYLNLLVRIAPGQTVTQQKQIKTTIRALPQGPVVQADPAQRPTAARLSMPSARPNVSIQPVSGIAAQGMATQIPTSPPSNLSSTATAVYPPD